jgi:hypothetical protein
MSLCGVFLDAIFLVFHITSVTSIQCYDCFRLYQIPVTTLPLTTDTLEGYVPTDCITRLTPNNQSRCEFSLMVNFWQQDPTLRTVIRTRANGDSIFLNQPFTGEHKASIILSAGLSIGTATWDSMYSVVYDYECATERCNSWEKVRTMINAATVKFNYNLVMTQLYEPISNGAVIPCLIYSNSTPVSYCSFCPTTSLLPCKTCEIQTCDKYSCAACSSNSSTTIYLFHHLLYDYISGKHSMRLEYNCNKPDCNSFSKQTQIKSMYTMRLDIGNGDNSSGVMVTVKILDETFLLLLCWCILVFSREHLTSSSRVY